MVELVPKVPALSQRPRAPSVNGPLLLTQIQTQTSRCFSRAGRLDRHSGDNSIGPLRATGHTHDNCALLRGRAHHGVRYERALSHTDVVIARSPQIATPGSLDDLLADRG